MKIVITEDQIESIRSSAERVKQLRIKLGLESVITT